VVAKVEFNSSSPLYIQVAERIRSDISRGVIHPGERLAAIRELATTYQVVPNTIVKALELLTVEGLISSRRTSGNFVTEDAKSIAEAKHRENMKLIAAFYHRMKLLGYNKDQMIEMLKNYDEDEKEHV